MRTIIGALILVFFLASCGSHTIADPAGLTEPKKTPDSIASENAEKVVQIVYGWQLYDTTYNEIWQEYVSVVDSATKKKYFSALYFRNAEGKVEPYLNLKKNLKQGNPIAISSTSCTGFVVSDDGYIVTTSSANSGWNDAYHFPESAFPGSLVSFENGKRKITNGMVKPEDVIGWVPTHATMMGGHNIATGQITGRNTFLDVLFAGSALHRPVFSSKTSSDHDISIVKVDVPEALNPVALKDSFEVQPAMEVVVSGYAPAQKSDSVVIDTRVPINDAAPVPKISTGNINKIISASSDSLFNGAFGDIYTLSMSPKDDSNNGAPVFSAYGDVIGIFNQGTDGKGNKIPFVIPIKYAIGFKGK
ncbi:MAG TPA: trypsin-like peptidase domain-containing protein [Chitinophagaceae bacterium]|nr:trypsin-like peptidase domain-containing protein [Chitinophagaceae bacterium]